MKLLVRDASLITRHKKDISDILKAIENWVSEAHIAASAVVFPGWGSERSSPSSKGDDDVDGDWRERWALEGLCDALLERGGLVPVSTKFVHAYVTQSTLADILFFLQKTCDVAQKCDFTSRAVGNLGASTNLCIRESPDIPKRPIRTYPRYPPSKKRDKVVRGHHLCRPFS